MNKFAAAAALIWVSLLVPSADVRAQTPTGNGQFTTTNNQLATSNAANALGATPGTTTNGQALSGTRSGATTGVICIQEMAATFCNLPSGPNTNGYGSPGGSGSSGGGATAAGGSGSGTASASSSGAGVNTSSIPACGGFPTPNELCN